MSRGVDTSILINRVDPRFPDKRRVATENLRKGITEDELRAPHQDGKPLLPIPDAFSETEGILGQFPIVNPFRM